MKIKDLQTGEVHEYGTNCHDSLYVSQDGRTLTYYNLQNGDGSGVGDYRFVCDDEKVPAESETADAIHCEVYFNIGGWNHREPQDNTPGDLISREALIKLIDESLQLYSSQYSTDMLNMFGLFREIIDNAPTVEQEVYITGTDYDFYIKGYKEGRKDFERPHGEWMPNNSSQFSNPGRSCSLCGKTVEFSENYCPNCGADMRKNEKKVQTPSCLTNPERHAELLERYKEGGAE